MLGAVKDRERQEVVIAAWWTLGACHFTDGRSSTGACMPWQVCGPQCHCTSEAHAFSVAIRFWPQAEHDRITPHSMHTLQAECFYISTSQASHTACTI